MRWSYNGTLWRVEVSTATGACCADSCGVVPSRAQAVSISYFLVGFDSAADRFFMFWFAAFLLYLVCVANSIMMSLLMPNHQILMIFFGLTQNQWWYVAVSRVR